MMGHDLARYIDHTLLKPEATAEQIRRLCAEAREHAFASVCINPVYVPLAAAELAGSAVAVCTVIGFPLGAARSEVKAFEAATAVRDGAGELDMVLSVGAMRAGETATVRRDIEAVVAVAAGRVVKVILETCLLDAAQIAAACRLCLAAGAGFVKTSTGFSTGGATVEHVRLMRETVGDACGVKASGGIRSRDDALAMIDAGATRLGTSAGVAIVSG